MDIELLSKYNLTPEDKNTLNRFMDEYFEDTYSSEQLNDSELSEINYIIDYIDKRFGSAKYILGLGLDFVLVAHQVSSSDFDVYEPNLEASAILSRHEQVTTYRNRTLNTLTLRGSGGVSYGIRSIEERILGLFHDEFSRLGYPSAYVYNTGQWKKYKDLLSRCFRLSLPGRFVAVKNLILYGLRQMSRAESFEGNPRIRLFSSIVKDYPRGQIEGENGGVIFQGIVYGYVKADRPHLSLIVDKVRTGSKRQKRIGDIDCYLDVKVEMSIEVKDFNIVDSQFQKQLGTFTQDVIESGIHGVVVAQRVSPEVRERLEDADIIVRTQNDLLRDVGFWDWPKQDAAVRGLFHYLAHVEQDGDAVERLQWFILNLDPEHDVLQGFNPDEKEPPASQSKLEPN